MNNSNERLAFITGYISSYQEKIRLSNKHGLFNDAKLFELFAQEVSELYFGKKFTNLNKKINNYPCVDLVADDEITYIQVSTAENIPQKIKDTLYRIKESKEPELKRIRNIKFFVLDSKDVGKVVDYAGTSKIGEIEFKKESDLITTTDIVERATSDLVFQISLYGLLKKDSIFLEIDIEKIENAINLGKEIGINNIDDKINDEYEIDRSSFISKIISDNKKNIAIIGEAGSGKSAVCKKFVENKKIVLFARAERFHKATDLDQIWGFDIKRALEHLCDQDVIFFIDSLETIADVRTSLDLLCALYECAKNYQRVKIITTCRTSNKSAFIKIESRYLINEYEVPALTIQQQVKIGEKYPNIKIMMDSNSYSVLLSSPFYINLIVSKISDISNISDENKLREYIWQNIIGLNDNKVIREVNKIVFDRAKNFVVGVPRLEYDTNIVNQLISKGVVIENQDNSIRLKYDIFEDICFEHEMDRLFVLCRGKYENFFAGILKLGFGVYRRYQMWISNKLLMKDNREKFLNKLVFAESTPIEWKKQTIIGLIKSRYSNLFFEENYDVILKHNLVKEFLTITNLYGFEIDKNNFGDHESIVSLKPSGEGRCSLVNLVFKSELYKKDKSLEQDIVKLCSDYSRAQKKDSAIAKNACDILEYFVEQAISDGDDFYDNKTLLLLEPVYRMSQYSKEWIKIFWEKMLKYYMSDDTDKQWCARNIFRDAVQHKHSGLAECVPVELCNIAEKLWTYTPHNKSISDVPSFLYNETRKHDRTYQYGLSAAAESYDHETYDKYAILSNFFMALFQTHFDFGLNWAIQFINKAMSAYKEKNEKRITLYPIYFTNSNKTKTYFGSPELWMICTKNNYCPHVISDLIYCMKLVLFNTLRKNDNIAAFAEIIKKVIYEKSNNIVLLTIIADLGIQFIDKLPGFALDLITNLEIVLLDLQRSNIMKPNYTMKEMEKQIWLTMSIPYQNIDRYPMLSTERPDLLNYMIESQLYGDDNTKKECYKIIDYLRSQYANDEKDASNYLQIQKMDVRESNITRIDDQHIAVVANVDGAAKEMVDKAKKDSEPDNKITTLINNCFKKIEAKIYSVKECIIDINTLLNIKEQCQFHSMYDSYIVSLMAWALNHKELDQKNRERFCKFWVVGINRYFSNKDFMYDYNCSPILFNQIMFGVSTKTNNAIKKLLLDIILYDGTNGIITRIARYAHGFLINNEAIAQSIFNTIIILANERYQFQESEKKSSEQLEESKTIAKYLFNSEELKIKKIDCIYKYDIGMLCYALNCGLTLETDLVKEISKQVIAFLVEKSVGSTRTEINNLLGVYAEGEFISFFNHEIVAGNKRTETALNILFDNVDFSKFTNEIFELYENVFGILLSTYFDSHIDQNGQKRIDGCEPTIKKIELKINNITDKQIKNKLYKILILPATSYGGLGDWRKIKVRYSYDDKKFLNYYFGKYGGLYLKDLIYTLYKLKINKLLPEILLGVRNAFQKSFEDKKKFATTMFETKGIVLQLISTAYLNFSDKIKCDVELTNAFEDILDMLVEVNVGEAAVILDEFRSR